MKKISLKLDGDRKIVNIKNPDTGEIVQTIPITEYVKMCIARAVDETPYTLENSRIWTNIGNKLSEMKKDLTDVELEDDEYNTLKAMVTAGVPKAFPTMKDRYWADSIVRIINEAKDIEPKKEKKK